MANIPILFLTAFKNSPLSFIAGLPYEKINSFHRWVGRLIAAIFLAHGILMGVLQCIHGNISFAQWTQGSDVRWGISALSCLLLLILLYLPLPNPRLNLAPVDHSGIVFMNCFVGFIFYLRLVSCSRHIIINRKPCCQSSFAFVSLH